MATTLLGGNTMNLVGNTPKVGETAPPFQAVDTDLSPKTLSDFPGLKLINVVPSLDTPVCDEQTKRFNQEAAQLSNCKFITISVDLPFAQKRWADAAKVSNIILLSDYNEKNFGTQYGVLIKEVQLLNRAIFVIDQNNVIRYVEVVGENFNHPNYEEALKAVKSIG